MYYNTYAKCLSAFTFCSTFFCFDNAYNKFSNTSSYYSTSANWNRTIEKLSSAYAFCNVSMFFFKFFSTDSIFGEIYSARRKNSDS